MTSQNEQPNLQVRLDKLRLKIINLRLKLRDLQAEEHGLIQALKEQDSGAVYDGTATYLKGLDDGKFCEKSK